MKRSAFEPGTLDASKSQSNRVLDPKYLTFVYLLPVIAQKKINPTQTTEEDSSDPVQPRGC